MARAIWSGVLTFGLVSVPVELYSATEAHGPVFHQFEKGTADRIRYQRVNERTGSDGRVTARRLDGADPTAIAPGRAVTDRRPVCVTGSLRRHGCWEVAPAPMATAPRGSAASSKP